MKEKKPIHPTLHPVDSPVTSWVSGLSFLCIYLCTLFLAWPVPGFSDIPSRVR